jgi:hypothetical protein
MSDWSEYLSAGWALVELRPGTKAPRAEGWQKAGAPFGTNVISAGLVHEHSGTCALDIDDMTRAEAWLAERGVAIADLFNAEDRVQLIGNPTNHGKLLYRLPVARKSKKVIETVDGKKRNILDFRCIGNQDVLPPSIHPETGCPYSWNYGDPALGHWSLLPDLPPALDAIWAALIGPATDGPAQSDLPAAEVSLDALELWLAGQDPDMDRDAWVAVGMRIHEATKGQGLYVWDNWSRKGEKYKGSQDLQAPWRSFKLGGGLGTGPILATQVAKSEDFPVEEADEFAPAADPSDTSAGAVTERLLSRLVYIAAQDRYYFIPNTERPVKNLDSHGNIGLSRAGVNALFGPHMPRIRSPKGAISVRKPVDFLEADMPAKLIVNNIGFHPGEGRLFTDVDELLYLNRYRAEAVPPLAPIHDELPMFERLMGRIEDENYRRWLMQFFAFILRNPGVKVQSAPLLYSNKQGTGKTTLMQVVPRLLYNTKYVTVASNDLLQARFTGYLADTWFVVLDEVKGDHGKLERVSLANKLKPWITDPLLPIERKGLEMYQVPNRLQITGTSNFEDALAIPNEDRRWGIAEMGGPSMSEKEALDLYAFLEGPRARGVLSWIFDRVDLAGFNPKAKPPNTLGRETMVRNSLGMWEQKIVQACANGEPPFDRDFVLAEDVRGMLLGTNAPSVGKVGEILKGYPFSCTVLRTDRCRYFCWRNDKIWSQRAPAELRAYFESGKRPFPALPWDLEVPLAIRRMSGDDGGPDDNSDLLGELSA